VLLCEHWFEVSVLCLVNIIIISILVKVYFWPQKAH